MLFHEIYGSYYRVVADILAEAVERPLTGRRLAELVQERAFGETALFLPDALRSGTWPLLDAEGRAAVRRPPTMPLTTLQKRWLKALLSDPRIALFDPDPAGLEEVRPLYVPGVFVRFDQYTDGDPYDDPDYIACFRTVLRALREGRRLELHLRGGTGRGVLCTPCRLEYSEKDDKFRLRTAEPGCESVNLARIRTAALRAPAERPAQAREVPRQELVLRLWDRRNALERAMLHFSHFERETTRLDEGHYQIRLRYDRGDRKEMLIRVLSFGPFLEVVGPEDFLRQLRSRIRAQCALTPPGEGDDER